MRTKGLLGQAHDFALSLPKVIRRWMVFLMVCFWVGHDLEEIPVSRWIWQPDRNCKCCGLIVEINYKDRERNEST